MTRRILPLIGMALLSGPLAAQQAPVTEFVSTIESGGYAGFSYVSPFPVSSWAPLDAAESTYCANPTAIPPDSASNIYISLEYSLVTELQGFAAYWALAGSSASLFDPFNRYLDSPPHIAYYIIGDLINDEGALGQTVVGAPEIEPSSAIGAVTLLLGGLMVLRGRRPARRLA
jgi:hypothetical protein